MTSPRSARVTAVRALHERRHRVERGAFVVEGPQAVEAAVRHGQVREVYATADALGHHRSLIERAAAHGARVVEVTDPVARALSETDHPQGIIAVCGLVARPWTPSIADGIPAIADGIPASATGGTAQARTGAVVVLDRVSDPGNAGTIIRSADAAGSSAVILTRGSVDPHNGKCVRATAGSLFHLPIVIDATAIEVVAEYQARGIPCLAADGSGARRLDDPAVQEMARGPVVWVFGSEAHGVSPEVREVVDATVSIPMRGGAESLNLAAAAAICLFAPLL